MTAAVDQAISVPIEAIDLIVCEIATDRPESDGTFEWASTTIVIVEVTAGDRSGLGYTYGSTAVARLIERELAPVVVGLDAMAVPASWQALVDAVRNIGRPGVASCAISALDVALWDLQGRLLELPLAALLGRVHESVAVYGSGGFTSYSESELRAQLEGWVGEGISSVKMKVGRNPFDDPRRVRAARDAIGPEAGLFVDANGAYERKQALALAEEFVDSGVSWFEEPVSSDDLEGLRLIRDRAPAGIDIAAGEYGYELHYFRRMLEAGAVDVLQADVTRCGGITELLRIGALCSAFDVPLSAHTAPSIHAHACAAIGPTVHIEYFHDHARIERLLFDGVLEPVEGRLEPALDHPGLGLELKTSEAERWAA